MTLAPRETEEEEEKEEEEEEIKSTKVSCDIRA